MPSSQRITWHPPFYKEFLLALFCYFVYKYIIIYKRIFHIRQKGLSARSILFLCIYEKI